MRRCTERPPGRSLHWPSGGSAPAWTRGARMMGSNWYRFPMEAVVDQAGRIVLPKFIRDMLGLPGYES